MHINRGLLFWGLALITAGAVALAVQQDFIDRDAVAGAWRLWPLILVAIGLAIVLARTPFAALGTVAAALVLGVAVGAAISVGPGLAVNCGSGNPASLKTQSGAFSGGSASVNLDFNCGTLVVSAAPGSGWEARTGSTGDGEARLESSAGELRIESPDRGVGLDQGRQRWEVDLGSEATYDLDVSVNAADSTFDLAGLQLSRLRVDPNAGSLFFDLSSSRVDELEISMNAGSAEVQTNAGTDLDGSIDMNAGSLKLCVDPGVGLQLSVNANFTFSTNFDGAGLERAGDTWTSSGYASAAHHIVLRLSGNAASVTLNPEGGCS